MSSDVTKNLDHSMPSETTLLHLAGSFEAERVVGKRILVMGSGSGSNFEALTHFVRGYGVEVAGVFCNRPGAYILERAARLGVPATLPDFAGRPSKAALNNAVLAFLEQPFDLLALAGYMRILPAYVVAPYADKIVNLHPSLLPEFPGLGAIQQAFEAGSSETGVTVHIVTPTVDDGPILGQIKVPIHRGMSIAALETRIHEAEHWLYPRAILHYLSRGE